MRILNLKATAAATTCAVAIFVLSILRPSSGFDPRTCVPSTHQTCATCNTTNFTYQCDPPGLPEGFHFGRCINVVGKCAEQRIFRCGEWTYTCTMPKKIIPGENACFELDPWICRSE